MRVLATVAAIFLVVPAAAEDYGTPLTGDQIKALYHDTKFNWVAKDSDKPITGTTTMFANGNAEGTYLWNNTERGTIKGKWWVEGDLRCFVRTTMPPNA